MSLVGLLAPRTGLSDMEKSQLSFNPLVISSVGSGSAGSGSTSNGGINRVNPQQAKGKLLEKLSKLNQGMDMKVAGYPGTDGGGKSYNTNDGNSFMSNTTYHSYVWSYCINWADPKRCQKWLDPYVSSHGIGGAGGDFSPLEEAAGKVWASMKKEGETGEGGRYAMWNVKARGEGGILDQYQRLDMERLSKMELVDEAKQKFEQVGYDTANRQIAQTYDENAGKGDNIMPNMESLRMMGSRWTDMYRRRMISIRGESLAAQKGIEFALGEDKNCEEYFQEANNQQSPDIRERIKDQGELEIETRNQDLQQRYEMCKQMMAASAYKAQQGEGRVDAWRARVNLAAVDYGGIDPNSVPKPEGEDLTKEETTQQIADWAEGGTQMNVVRESNGQTLQGYNKQLKEAAQGMAAAAARSPFIADASSQILDNQIEIGEKSLVEINGLTREMRNHLQDAPGPKEVVMSTKQAGQNLPRNPAQLTITALQ